MGCSRRCQAVAQPHGSGRGQSSAGQVLEGGLAAGAQTRSREHQQVRQRAQCSGAGAEQGAHPARRKAASAGCILLLAPAFLPPWTLTQHHRLFITGKNTRYPSFQAAELVVSLILLSFAAPRSRSSPRNKKKALDLAAALHQHPWPCHCLEQPQSQSQSQPPARAWEWMEP